jgi:hypothetical protein
LANVANGLSLTLQQENKNKQKNKLYFPGDEVNDQ